MLHYAALFDAQEATADKTCAFFLRIPGIANCAMDPDIPRPAGLPSDLKSEGTDDSRELLPDLESIKGSQGSVRSPMVGPGRGSVGPIKGTPKDNEQSKEPDAVDPNDSHDDPAHSIKESSAESVKSAVSMSASQGIKPKEQLDKTSVKEFPFKAFLKGTL